MNDTVRRFRIGIIGAGQLARMMYQAAISLGIEVRILAEGPAVSAAQVAADVVVGDYTDPETVQRFAAECDAITFDHEHVPIEILRDVVAAGIDVRPGPEALIHAQDKAVMRRRLSDLGVPCPDYRIVATPADLVAAGDELGWPLIAKTSRGGYDGKGVWKLTGPDQAELPFAALSGRTTVEGGTIAATGVQIIAEEFVDFACELSVIVARSPSGQAVAYPPSQTVQQDGICVETTTPAPGLDPDQASAIQHLGLTIADELGVVGLLAVELMQRRDRSVVVNELAMRPHNTGHWSIDGAYTSQFENHLRAVADLPLGDPTCREPWTVMRNVLGGSVADLPSALLHCFARDRRLRAHLYGKTVTARRKVGHVTCCDDDCDRARARARHAAGYLMGESNE